MEPGVNLDAEMLSVLSTACEAEDLDACYLTLLPDVAARAMPDRKSVV